MEEAAESQEKSSRSTSGIWKQADRDPDNALRAEAACRTAFEAVSPHNSNNCDADCRASAVRAAARDSGSAGRSRISGLPFPGEKGSMAAARLASKRLGGFSIRCTAKPTYRCGERVRVRTLAGPRFRQKEGAAVAQREGLFLSALLPIRPNKNSSTLECRFPEPTPRLSH